MFTKINQKNYSNNYENCLYINKKNNNNDVEFDNNINKDKFVVYELDD